MTQSSNTLNAFNDIISSSDYDRKVAAKNKEMQYVSEMENRADKRLGEQLVSEEQINKQKSQIDEITRGLLDQDVDRVKSVEKEARKRVTEGVARHQGNLKQYLASGGMNDLREYRKDVINSKELASGLRNMQSFKAIQSDISEGKISHDVNVKFKRNGKSVEQLVDVDTMMDLYRNNKILEINYNGGEKPEKLSPFDFQKNFNPRSPDVSKPVTEQEYAEFLTIRGQSSDIAVKMAKSAFAQGDSDNLWWGVRKMDWTGTNSRWGQTSRGRTSVNKGKGDKFIADAYRDFQVNGTPDKRSSFDWITAEGEKRPVVLEDFKVNGSIKDATADLLGFRKGESGAYSKHSSAPIEILGRRIGQTVTLKSSDYDLMGLGNKITRVVDSKDNSVHLMASAQIWVTEDVMEGKMQENSFGGDSNIFRSVQDTDNNRREGWGFLGIETTAIDGLSKDVGGSSRGEGRLVQVMIPLPTNDISIQKFNEAVNLKANTVQGGIGGENFFSSKINPSQGDFFQDNRLSPTNQSGKRNRQQQFQFYLHSLESKGITGQRANKAANKQIQLDIQNGRI